MILILKLKYQLDVSYKYFTHSHHKKISLLTFGWNIIFILVRVKIVIGATIRYLIKHKVNYCNKNL